MGLRVVPPTARAKAFERSSEAIGWDGLRVENSKALLDKSWRQGADDCVMVFSRAKMDYLKNKAAPQGAALEGDGRLIACG